jgi:hypothetical protein
MTKHKLNKRSPIIDSRVLQKWVDEFKKPDLADIKEMDELMEHQFDNELDLEQNLPNKKKRMDDPEDALESD